MIIDAKNGKPGPSHAAQVLIYQDAVPKSLVEYCGVDFRGHVVYPDAHVGIPASRRGREVHREPCQLHKETGFRNADPEGPQLRGVQVVRHHKGGLP